MESAVQSQAVSMPRVGENAPSFNAAKDRMDGKEAGLECKDWFFCTKKIDKDKIISAITKKK